MSWLSEELKKASGKLTGGGGGGGGFSMPSLSPGAMNWTPPSIALENFSMEKAGDYRPLDQAFGTGSQHSASDFWGKTLYETGQTGNPVQSVTPLDTYAEKYPRTAVGQVINAALDPVGTWDKFREDVSGQIEDVKDAIVPGGAGGEGVGSMSGMTSPYGEDLSSRFTSFADTLKDRSEGKGDSLAGLAMKSAQDRNMKQMAAMYAAQPQSALATRNLQNQQAMGGQQLAQDTGIARLQEQQQADTAYGNLLSTMGRDETALNMQKLKTEADFAKASAELNQKGLFSGVDAFGNVIAWIFGLKGEKIPVDPETGEVLPQTTQVGGTGDIDTSPTGQALVAPRITDTQKFSAASPRGTQYSAGASDSGITDFSKDTRKTRKPGDFSGLMTGHASINTDMPTYSGYTG